ncbi:hypothetical protein L21SP3_02038 [Sedimentisphaera cyanobacteriorum]|uniref:Uncharacterized protein n=1 Tax=Sedimentisphaera cyanobacteriorum TaxID=1940790 RepID=A0A1Q2HS46_9BACT|nr:hypothetical protein [Sedimentisphaera cyanobacteriorum]AQQ10210.1 hypothetical protein L21SP3_02038 [Sedimentisphaera cyanobacteriorum]
MKPLSANLSIYYKRPMAYFWYFITLCQVPAAAMSITGHIEESFLFLIIPLFFGVLAGAVQKDIVSAPLTFCLPGQRNMPIKAIAGFGIVMLAAMLLLFFFAGFTRAGSPFANPFYFAVNILLCIFVYLYAALIGFKTDPLKTSITLRVLPFAAALLIIFGSRFVNAVLTGFPVCSGLVIAAVSAYLASNINNPASRREICGKEDAVSTLSGWNSNFAMLKLKTANMAEKRNTAVSPCFAEKLFLSVNKKLKGSSAKTSADYIYIMLDKFLLNWKQFLFAPFLVLLLFGYILGFMPSVESNPFSAGAVHWGVFFALPAMWAGMWELPLNPSMALTSSRKDKLNASLAFLLAYMMLTACVFLLAGLVAKAAAPYMPAPDLGIVSDKFQFAPPCFQKVWLLFFITPLSSCACAVWGRKSKITTFIFPLIIMFVVIISGLEENIQPPALLVFRLAGISLSWIIAYSVIKFRCLKGNLAGNNFD